MTYTNWDMLWHENPGKYIDAVFQEVTKKELQRRKNELQNLADRVTRLEVHTGIRSA